MADKPIQAPFVVEARRWMSPLEVVRESWRERYAAPSGLLLVEKVYDIGQSLRHT